MKNTQSTVKRTEEVKAEELRKDRVKSRAVRVAARREAAAAAAMKDIVLPQLPTASDLSAGAAAASSAAVRRIIPRAHQSSDSRLGRRYLDDIDLKVRDFEDEEAYDSGEETAETEELEREYYLKQAVLFIRDNGLDLHLEDAECISVFEQLKEQEDALRESWSNMRSDFRTTSSSDVESCIARAKYGIEKSRTYMIGWGFAGMLVTRFYPKRAEELMPVIDEKLHLSNELAKRYEISLEATLQAKEEHDTCLHRKTILKEAQERLEKDPENKKLKRVIEMTSRVVDGLLIKANETSRNMVETIMMIGRFEFEHDNSVAESIPVTSLLPPSVIKASEGRAVGVGSRSGRE